MATNNTHWVDGLHRMWKVSGHNHLEYVVRYRDHKQVQRALQVLDHQPSRRAMVPGNFWRVMRRAEKQAIRANMPSVTTGQAPTDCFIAGCSRHPGRHCDGTDCGVESMLAYLKQSEYEHNLGVDYID